MGGKKVYDGYRAFSFLEPGFDYKEFRLTAHPRVEPHYLPLSKVEEERFQGLMEETVLVDLHEHPVLWPEDMTEVPEMNRLGILVDVGHTTERTALDKIEASDAPIYNSNSGPATIAQGHTTGDEVLQALAESGGLIGVGGAGRGLRTEKNPVGNIESYMECIEYCIELMGVDHVGCGPDTLYGAHQELYSVWFPLRMGHHERPGTENEKPFPKPEGMVDPGYVKGLENPNEYVNIAQWTILHGYSDEEIKKVVGHNALRLLGEVWV